MTLRFGAGAATRVISRELGISRSTVREYLARIATAGIPWPLPAELSVQELERRLFVNGGVRTGARHYVEPDWVAAARELKRPGVNLMILWEEYQAVHPDGYAHHRQAGIDRRSLALCFARHRDRHQRNAAPACVLHRSTRRT